MRSLLLLVLALAACGRSSATTADVRCPAGWSVTKIEWTGTDSDATSLVCQQGVPVYLVEQKRRGRVWSAKSVMKRESWDELWKDLDQANWRGIEQRSSATAAISVEITDGKVTKKLGWGVPFEPTMQERAVLDVFTKASLLEEPPMD